MIAAFADIVLLPTDEGGLKAPLATPSRSLLLHTDAGPVLGPVVIGVLISTPDGAALAPGDEIRDARLDFWVDLADVYLDGPGQEFYLGYPSRVIGRGQITSIFAGDHR